MPRILIVLDQLSLPGSTVRGLQYKRLFESHPQWNATFVCQTSTWVNAVLQRWPHRPLLRWPLEKLNRVLQRFRQQRIISRARDHDLVYVLTVPAFDFHRSLCDLPNTSVLMDLLDAVWLPWFRRFGWEHLEEMLRCADGVVCENRITAEFAVRHNPSVFIAPDSPQLQYFDACRSDIQKASDQVVLGWIGGPNSVDALYAIFEPLEQLFAQHGNLHLRILGATRERLPRFENVQFSVVEAYDQATMVQEALKMHIGLYPQFDVEESRNRGTLKAKIYMSAGAVAACQDIGENSRLISHGVNGVLASSPEQWLHELESLVMDPSRRQDIAERGLQTIREQFTTEACFDRLLAIFDEFVD